MKSLIFLFRNKLILILILILMYCRKEEAVAKDKKSSKKEKESKDKHKKGIMHLQQILYIYVLRRGKKDLKSEKIKLILA